MNLQQLTKSIVNLEIGKVAGLVKQAIADGVGPISILDACRKGMDEVGRRYQAGEYFLSDLIMAGESMKEALAVLRPYLRMDMASSGKIVLGTIQGDIHDIGKDIVMILLVAAGFEVCDLGIDVTPSVFVKRAKEAGATIIGVSALLSTSVLRLADVVEELKKAGIRSQVKVIAGGAAVRPRLVNEFGLDAAVNDAVEGLKIVKAWSEKAR